MSPTGTPLLYLPMACLVCGQTVHRKACLAADEGKYRDEFGFTGPELVTRPATALAYGAEKDERHTPISPLPVPAQESTQEQMAMPLDR